MIATASVLALGSCTNLDETLYDQVGSDNYYNTKMDVIRAVFRPFECLLEYMQPTYTE